MSGFHDQQSGARSEALPAGGHTRSGAFATPGKRTLTQGLTGARGSGPIQLQGDGQSHPIPDGALVSQYGPGSDPKRLNDCGPSCILMALRAMGLEQKLKDQIPKDFRSVNDDGSINDQTEVEYICFLGFNGDRHSRVRRLDQIQQCLITVLGKLGVSVPEPEKTFQLLSPPGQPFSSDTNKQQSKDPSLGMPQGAAGEFIKQNCKDGSAVMVLGDPLGGPWGWGGMQDPGNTHRVTDDGSHIVLVWLPDQKQPDKYTVLDPSWTAPLPDKPLQDVIKFMYARGGPSGDSVVLNVMAVPYQKVAELTAGKTAQGAGQGPAVLAKRGDGPAAPVEDAGAGAALPEPTRFKLQDLFGTDLSAVRVHQGGAAPSVGALAYAQGDDVHFAPGRFQPGTPDGDRLIGHEVAHVVQQREGRVAAPQHKGAVVADAALEAEADAFGDRAAQGEVTGGPVRAAQPARGGEVQRQGDVHTIIMRLGAIAGTARGYADELLPKTALGPAPGPKDPDPARIQTIKQDLDAETHEVDQLSTGATDNGVKQAAQAANDAIVAARAAIAVRAGDSVAQQWAAKGTDQGTMLHDIRKGSAGGSGDDYCGEFVKATFVSAGLDDFATPGESRHFRSIFNHTDAVQAFFRYQPDENNRNPLWILPHNDPAQGWQTVAAYHAARNSSRIVVETATVEAAQTRGALDTVLRAGDVVTLYLHGSDPSHADHTAMIRRVIDGKTFETMEGNDSITTAAGKDEWGIGTNEWDTLATPKDSRTFESTTRAGTQHARVFLVGRLSAVDFEAGHGYSLTDPTAGQPRPGAKHGK
jgi:hypothetical protein